MFAKGSVFAKGSARLTWGAVRVRPEVVGFAALLTALAVLVAPGVRPERASADPPPPPPAPTPGRLAYVSDDDYFHYLAATDGEGAEHPLLPPDTSPPNSSDEGDAKAGLYTWIADDDGRAIMLARGDTVTTLVPAVNGVYNSHPVLSADGKQVAFSSYTYGEGADSTPHIFTVNTDGTGRKQITNDAAGDTWPTWDPSGENIAFARWTDANSGNDIWRINIASKAKTRLTSTRFQETEPAWSPDGLRIAYTLSGAYTDPSTGQYTTEVVSIPAGGGDPRREVYPYWPRPSEQAVWTAPTTGENARLAFTSSLENNTSYGVYERDAFHVVNPVSDEPDQVEEHPFWNPDTNVIGYTAHRNVPTSRISTIRVDGTDQQPFGTRWDARDSDPVYSPDGSKLAFSRQAADGDSADIIIADLVAGTQSPLPGPRPGYREFYVDPAWSADGRFIAYGHEFTKLVTGEDPTNVSAIAVVAVATGQRTELPVETSTNGYSYSFDGEPSFDPAGARIVFSRAWVTRGGDGGGPVVSDLGRSYSVSVASGVRAATAFPSDVDSDLYLTAFPFPAGVRASQLTNDLDGACDGSPGCRDRGPAWDPVDPNTIVFTRDHDDLDVVNPATGAVTAIPVNSDFVSGVADPAWNPTGTQLAFTGFASESYPSIYLLPPAGGTPVHLTSTPPSVGQPAYQNSSDLMVTADVDAATIEYGATTAIHVTVTNLGLATVVPTLTLSIPPGLAVVSIAAGTGTCDPRTLVCTGPSLVAGTSWPVAITVKGVQSGTHPVTADVSSPLVDPNPANNHAATRITVGEPPDVALSGTITPAPGYVGGEQLILTFTVQNGLRAPAHGVTLNVSFPVNMPPPVAADPPACLVSPCLIGEMAPDEARTVTYTIDPVAAFDEQAVGVVSLTGTEDPNPVDNVATVRIQIVQPVLTTNPGLSPPGRVILATGKDFPPGATVGFRWSEGISAEETTVVKPDGTLEASILIFNRDAPGDRELVARYLGGELFGDVKAPFLVVPGDQSPPDFVGRR